MNGVLAVASTGNSKIRTMLQGRRHTLDTLAETRRLVAPAGFDYWFHAASLGEFEQGRHLIERIRREHPDVSILLSFFSPSGYKVRCNYSEVDAVCYLPADTPAAVRAFLDAAQPRCAIIIKYEFWNNLLGELQRREIPTYSISSIFRPGQRFFRSWGEPFRRALRCFTHLYVQDENSRDLLASIGITNVTVAGDTRFDRVTDIRRDAKPLPAVVEALVADCPFTLVVGSSWQPDEDIIFPWWHANPDCRLIVAPHEFGPHRLERMLHDLGKGAYLLSQIADKPLPADCRAIIVDCFGLLSSLYRIASVAYIGGGFGAGIHNINEAAVYGIPVIYGPNNHKFKEARDLANAGGGFEIAGSDDFIITLDRLHRDPQFRSHAGSIAGDYIARNIGASDIIYNDLFPNTPQ